MRGFWRSRIYAAAIAVSSLMSLSFAGGRPTTQVYVYVQHESPVRSWFPVWCDGVLVAKIKQGRFFIINVEPGRHEISEEKGVPAFVDVRSGKKAFVRLEWRNGELGGPALPVWEEVTQSAAHDDMIYLGYIDADKVVSKLVPSTEPREAPRLRRRGNSNDN
jgi:hypothetical protein